MKTCMECEEKAEELHDDPRTPPLEIEPCLCRECFINAASDEIDEYEEKIASLKKAISRVTR